MIVWAIVGICFKGASGAAAICNFAPLSHGLGQEAVHQDLRLPDERLRFRPHGGRAGSAGYARTETPDDADMGSSIPVISARRLPRRSSPNSATGASAKRRRRPTAAMRSEEHTSELQQLMRIS